MFLAAGPAQEGERVVEDVAEAAKFERRRRLLVGGFSLSTGAVRVTAGGMLLHASDDASSGLARAGRRHVIAGGATLITGITAMALPGPLDRLARGRSFRRLERDPQSAFALAAFHDEWSVVARRARVVRIVGGSLSIAIGTTLVTLASIQTFGRRRSPEHTILDVSMLGTGAGLLGGGITGVVLESEVERAYLRHEARRVVIAPSIGGLSLTGRF